MSSLEGKVAVVAGATRGAGRGIACALGEAGAIVYCTGRSVRGQSAMRNRPECIEDTAELVTERGGQGIHARVDHTKPKEVQAFFERVRDEQGGLDLLVNDVWGGDELTGWGQPFWRHSLRDGLTMLERAVHTHLITSHYGAPLLIERGRGLIVEITDGDNFGYRANLYYDIVKTTVIRLAFGMARELNKKGVCSIALTPGFLRSEVVLDHFCVTEESWRDAGEKDPDFLASETPLFVGRAVAALATDPDVAKKNGRVFSSWGLAREYGFQDVDGRTPHWGDHVEKVYGVRLPVCDDAFYAHWEQSLMDVAFPGWDDWPESIES